MPNRSDDVLADDSVAYFRAAELAFEKAAQAMGGMTERTLDVAGFNIRLRFAGAAMVPIVLPALAHRLRTTTAEADFEIGIWDSRSTGVAHPAPAWGADDFRERGRIEGFNNERIKTCFQMGPDSLSILDSARSRGYFWVRDADQVPYYETGAPLRNLFHWWLGDRGLLFVHAAAVGAGNSGALLVGRGGSGKSTTALACLAAGFHYVSDDYCVVSLGGSPVVHSIYNTAKLTHDTGQRFPRLASFFGGIDAIEEDKRLFFLYPSHRESIASALPLKAVFVPGISDDSVSAARPTSPMNALRALAPSSIFQLSGAGATDFARCGHLVRQVQCLALDLGSDVRQSTDVIRARLESLSND